MIPFETKSAVISKPWTYMSKRAHDAIAIPASLPVSSMASSNQTFQTSPLLSTRRNNRRVRRWLSIFGF